MVGQARGHRRGPRTDSASVVAGGERPHRVVYADANATVPALLVMADTSTHVGRGRGRNAFARFLELLRGTGHRLGVLTNGFQFRLVYAGLDFESWCEWEADRWFDDGEGAEELAGLRQLLSPDSLKPVKEGVSGLLDAVEESRKRQARLSDFLQENVREAIEFLLEDVSKQSRTNAGLFASLVRLGTEDPLSDTQANEALYQATVRLVMRLVVCLFAESRPELRFNGPVYDHSYGVRTLYERLEEAVRFEGGIHALFNQQTAWPRLMALFRLIHDGSLHPDLMFPERGGLLFRPGSPDSPDPVARALHVLESLVPVSDSTIHAVLRKLLRARLPVIRGRTKTWVEGPVDFSDLRTQVIGLIYEGLLDYRLKRTDEAQGPMVFLNIGRQPVLPLRRLEDMLAHDRTGLKNLLTTLRKEQVTASATEEDDEPSEDEAQPEEPEEGSEEEVVAEEDESVELEVTRTGEYLAAEEAARRWARDAAVLAGMVGRQRARETDADYQSRLDAEAANLIKRVTVLGEFYLVRAGNTRKGSGTFYTRPELSVPTVHRTLEPLCYVVDGGWWMVGRRVQMAVQNFRDLEVWQQAMELVTLVYQRTQVFPKEETYGLTNQLHRAAVSVPSNIAEGQGRRSTKEFLNHLSMARGSLLEVQTQIEIATRLSYLDQTTSEVLLNQAVRVNLLLNGLIRSLEARLAQD